MTTDAKNLNLRVLVIDDNPDIREDFRKILHAKVEEESFTEARTALFGEPPLSEAHAETVGVMRSRFWIWMRRAWIQAVVAQWV